MALLLCIDTAAEQAFVGLCDGAAILASVTSTDQKNHASFVQPAIEEVMRLSARSFTHVDAVAVVNGPGSYTGLRVGLASAKGICYAANKPLLLLNTLETMALAAIEECGDEKAFYCPMIDARRNEVFAAVYTFSFQSVLSPQPLIIDATSFTALLKDHKIFFFGSGQSKSSRLITHKNALFVNIYYSLNHINQLAQQRFLQHRFDDVAYAEPFYVKEFYMPAR